jgi:hypothetical protein
MGLGFGLRGLETAEEFDLAFVDCLDGGLNRAKTSVGTLDGVVSNANVGPVAALLGVGARAFALGVNAIVAESVSRLSLVRVDLDEFRGG